MNRSWAGYAWAAAATAVATAVAMATAGHLNVVNVAMIYLLAVVIVALRSPGAPAVLASILCVATFDFLFVPPVGAFSVDDAQYLVAFAIMLGVALVISRLVEKGRRRARSEARLEMEAETERIRSTLLASISHDLRTPLSVIAGASSTLAERGEEMDASERRSLARSVFRQSQEMSEHVSKVLQMTRLETGAVAVQRDWASIGEIVGVVLARSRHLLGSHRLVVEIPEDLPLVRVDAGLIGQVLGNLVENAARHTPRDTVVRLRASASDEDVVVSVEDYGGGIAPQDLERVFEKFHRGMVEAGQGGMGLGLAICRAIVRLHGGRTWAENLPAGGTAFRFSVPLDEAPAACPREAPA